MVTVPVRESDATVAWQIPNLLMEVRFLPLLPIKTIESHYHGKPAPRRHNLHVSS